MPTGRRRGPVGIGHERRGELMKAIVRAGRGSADGLELKEVTKPVPQGREVLIRVRAATVTSGDVFMRNLSPLLWSLMRVFGFRRKHIPGHEFAGEVEAVGSDVERFEVGDQLFGTTTGLSVGGNAEYLCLPETWAKGVVAVKPANLSFEEAAALPIGGMTALFILRKGHIESGHKVLVYGASGSVGSYAVQIAKHLGAEVTGVSSTANLELVASLGADHVIDYTVDEVGGGDARYDVIFDAVGKTSRARLEGSLAEGGTYLTVRSLTNEKLDDLNALGELAEAGVIRPFIDRRYPLAQVPEAYRYVKQGHKRGNVVITV